MVHYRQGDVLLVKIEKLPAGLKRKNDKVLAYGETTGHHHRLTGKGTILYSNEQDQQFAEMPEADLLVHDEHGPHQIPAGAYEVRIQRELDLAGEIRRVMD